MDLLSTSYLNSKLLLESLSDLLQCGTLVPVQGGRGEGGAGEQGDHEEHHTDGGLLLVRMVRPHLTWYLYQQ